MKGGLAMLYLIKQLSRWHRRFLVEIVVLLALAIVPDALAGDSLEFLRVFQKNQMPGNQEIRESYTNFTYKPYEREELSFNILIPNNDWRDIPITIDLKTLQQDAHQLIPLAKQMAPESEKGEAKIEVAYMRLELEMALCDYVNIFLQNNKDHFDLLMRRKGQYTMRTVEELLLRSEQDAKGYMARLTFSRHGDRVFLVSCSALESEFIRYAECFTVAAVSFAAFKNSPTSYVEKMAVFTSSGRPKLKFKHPESWTAEELHGLSGGRTGVDIKLTVRDEKDQPVLTYGYIHVSAFSENMGKTPYQIMNSLKKDFEEMPISLDTCTLKADFMPKLAAPLGKLERWNADVKGSPGEVAFLVIPQKDDYIAMGLFSMRPEDNLLTWSHTWRVFEIIAGDLAGKTIDLAKLKNHTLPSENQLKRIAGGTMDDFTKAVRKQNFDDFYDNIANTFKLQVTTARLNGAFKGFAKVKAMEQLGQYAPILEKGICINKDGILKFSGHYPTQPEATTFRLTYIQEKNDWKLLGIHVAMKKMSEDDNRQSDKSNVLCAENGGQVIFCSSQYNQTSWGAKNLIDSKLGHGHGYASKNRNAAEIIFAMPKTETIRELCFNPYTVESPNTWAKRVRVEVSTQSPEKGFVNVGGFTLHNRRDQEKKAPLADQCFDITPIQARYIKLQLLSNYGGSYIEMGEFKAYSAAK
jgi:hypothetical protein